MSYSKGPAHIALIEFRHDSVSAEAYDSIGELLVHRLRRTSGGLAPYFGHPQHLEALKRLRVELDAAIVEVEGAMLEEPEKEKAES